jgi:outer membrane protein TolC
MARVARCAVGAVLSGLGVLALGLLIVGSSVAQQPAQQPVQRLSPQPAQPPCSLPMNDCLVDPYWQRAASAGTGAGFNEPIPSELHVPMPEGYVPWWQKETTSAMRSAPRTVWLGVDELVWRALRHSARVRFLSDGPLIGETSIDEAVAAFDPSAFIETRYDDTSEPVGSALTTGGPPRYRDNDFSHRAGLRRSNQFGGQTELAQEFGYQDTNSVFFIPTQQARSRLLLRYTQPLLSGAGRNYNLSAVVQAELNSQMARDEFSTQMQDYLVELHGAYWELYLERAALTQRRHLFEAGREILAELESRREVDVVESQILQAKARIATRYNDIVRGEMLIRNAEARIRALVNDPEITAAPGSFELVPRHTPRRTQPDVSLRNSLIMALEHRPEIRRSLRSIRSAAVQQNVSHNELLPTLDLVLESFVMGLQGESDVGQAYVDQFSVGEPSYSVGLQLEFPLGNRAARARYRRSRLEVRQLTSEFRVAIEQMLADVEVAVREVEASYREMETSLGAIRANAAELEFLTRRWRLLPSDRQLTSVVLENLLDAQERLADAERTYTRALVLYNLALVKQQRAQGTLLSVDAVIQGVACEDGLPRLLLGPPASAAPENVPSPPPGTAPQGTTSPYGVVPHGVSPYETSPHEAPRHEASPDSTPRQARPPYAAPTHTGTPPDGQPYLGTPPSISPDYRPRIETLPHRAASPHLPTSAAPSQSGTFPRIAPISDVGRGSLMPDYSTPAPIAPAPIAREARLQTSSLVPGQMPERNDPVIPVSRAMAHGAAPEVPTPSRPASLDLMPLPTTIFGPRATSQPTPSQETPAQQTPSRQSMPQQSMPQQYPSQQVTPQLAPTSAFNAAPHQAASPTAQRLPLVQ